LGSVFKITLQGGASVLYNFDGTHGKFPYGGLTLATDGNFYGTTSVGGSTNLGVIFKITPAVVLTVLHTFASGDGITPYAPPIQVIQDHFGGSVDGSALVYASLGRRNSLGGLVQASDGNLYGVGYLGGASNHGTIFRIAPGGTFSRRYSFGRHQGRIPNGDIARAHNWHSAWRHQHRRYSQHGRVLQPKASLPPYAALLPSLRQGWEVNWNSRPGIQQRHGSVFQRHSV